ncbi:hypothetical protein, partial [Bradyrhizobium uaiense]|uniref:hypothetical protein n=1 Tax=Bradyrhizobium uaiense TaxID=2594946 RepID=UPI0019D63B0A
VLRHLSDAASCLPKFTAVVCTGMAEPLIGRFMVHSCNPDLLSDCRVPVRGKRRVGASDQAITWRSGRADPKEIAVPLRGRRKPLTQYWNYR